VRSFGSKHAEGQIVDHNAHCDDEDDEDHSLVAYRFNEAVEDLGECVSADPCSSDAVGIPVHTMLPVLTNKLQSGRPLITPTIVFNKIHCTRCAFLQ